MSTKEHYDIAVEVLTKFIESIESHGIIVGFAYSFSPRKVEIEHIGSKCGVLIRRDEVYATRDDKLNTRMHLDRVRNESASFQSSCTGEYCCDEALEQLIEKALDSYHTYLKTSLLVGVWEK